MALTFPLNRATFFAGLKVASTQFWPGSSLMQSVSGGGEVLTSDHGTRLWRAVITLPPARHKDASAIMAIMSVLSQSGSSFLAYDKVNAYPAADPSCTILGAATPTISVFNANNRDITIIGLPANYVLSVGDHLSFTYGSPVRYALHQIAVGATAGPGGSAVVEVTPRIRPGAVGGVAVTLNKPWCKMVLDAGGYNPATASAGISSGLRFSATQTLG